MHAAQAGHASRDGGERHAMVPPAAHPRSAPSSAAAPARPTINGGRLPAELPRLPAESQVVAEFGLWAKRLHDGKVVCGVCIGQKNIARRRPLACCALIGQIATPIALEQPALPPHMGLHGHSSHRGAGGHGRHPIFTKPHSYRPPGAPAGAWAHTPWVPTESHQHPSACSGGPSSIRRSIWARSSTHH